MMGFTCFVLIAGLVRYCLPGKSGRFNRCVLCCAVVFLGAGDLQAQFLNNIVREVKRGGKNFGKVIDKGVKDVTKTTAIAIHDIGKATGKAADDARKTIEKGLVDASVAAGKATKDIAAETKRVGANAADAGNAIVKYIERTVSGTSEALQQAERRLREGKLLDAMFHLALDPLTVQEEAAFMATQESGWLNTVGAAAATAYGGAAGAAAYSTWQTYRATGGNAELALRAGLITGLTSVAMSGLGEMSATTNADMLKKAVLAGSVGGLAIAASGGDADDIRDGFLLGGGMMLVRDAYSNYTGHPLDAKGATGDPYCMSPADPSCETLRKAFDVDAEGNPRLNTALLDRNASFVGIGSDPLHPPRFGADIPPGSDQSLLMRTVAKVPGMNAMGLFHDKWVVSWKMAPLLNKMTIFPAVVLTYMGTGAGLQNKISETVSESGIAQPATLPGAGKPAVSGSPATPIPAAGNPVAGNDPVAYRSPSGDVYYGKDGFVFNRWGQQVKDAALIASLSKVPATVAPDIRNTPADLQPYMYNFSNPNTGVATGGDSVMVPNGFNGDASRYQELPPLELAMKYAYFEAWEKYGMENMSVIQHAIAPVGSVLYVRNLANGQMVRVFVVGGVSAADRKAGITMRLSQKAVEGLGATGKLIWVESEYDNISIDSRNIIRNGAGISGKLVFNNLRNGRWELYVFDDFKTVYKTRDYKNDLMINFPPGRYGFELSEISPGQTYRAYSGTFIVN